MVKKVMKMVKCPKCGENINVLKSYGEYSSIFDGKTHTDGEYVPDSLTYECLECGEEIFRSEGEARRFLTKSKPIKLKGKKGWKFESVRHGMSARGLPSGKKKKNGTKKFTKGIIKFVKKEVLNGGVKVKDIKLGQGLGKR